MEAMNVVEEEKRANAFVEILARAPRCSNAAASASNWSAVALRQNASTERLRTSGSAAVIIFQSSLNLRPPVRGQLRARLNVHKLRKHIGTVLSAERKSELSIEQSVLYADVESLALLDHGKILLALRQFSQRG